MRMTQKRKAILAAIDRFDEAAQSWGWQVDHGAGDEVGRSEAAYHDAKAVLCSHVAGRRREVLAAIERFDAAAQSWGWQSDLGAGDAVGRSEAEHKAAREALVAVMIGVKPAPAAPSVDAAAPSDTQKRLRTFSIPALVDAAVVLDGTGRDLMRCDVDLQDIEARLQGVSPQEIERICNRLAVLRVGVDGLVRVLGDLVPTVRAWRPTGPPDDVRALVASLAADAAGQAKRLELVRHAFRRIHAGVGDALSTYRTQSAGLRLERILRPGAVLTIDALSSAVAADHRRIADAFAAWRMIHDTQPFWSVAESTSQADLEFALRDLVASGRLAQNLSIRGRRWTVL